jgi:hypothetical protein
MSILSPRRRRLVKCVLSAAVVTTVVVGPASAADAPRTATLNAATAFMRREFAATIAGAPILAGFTSQGGPIVLQISNDGRRVQRAAIALVIRCTSGSGFVYPDALVRLSIRPNGRVRFARTASFLDSSGDLIKTSHSFGASVNRRQWTASGHWRVHLDVTTSTGRTDSCDTGSVSFHTRL